MGKNNPAANHGPTPSLVPPQGCVLGPLGFVLQLYMRSNHRYVEGAHTYVDFATFSLPAWCTGALSGAVHAVIAAALLTTFTSWGRKKQKHLTRQTAEMLERRQPLRCSLFPQKVQQSAWQWEHFNVNNSVGHFKRRF